VPDFIGKPSWGQPITVDIPDNSNLLELYETAIPDIVIAQYRGDTYTFAAIDLNQNKVLWLHEGSGSVELAGSHLLILDYGFDATKADLLDIQTGQRLDTTTLSGHDNFIFANDDIMITYNPVTTTLCGRQISSLGRCAWRLHTDLTDIEFPNAFGGGRWLNTRDGVISTTTGQPAPFGAPDRDDELLSDIVGYIDGPEDGAMRVKINHSKSEEEKRTLTFEHWDIAKSDTAG